jgi:hypothetical protein
LEDLRSFSPRDTVIRCSPSPGRVDTDIAGWLDAEGTYIGNGLSLRLLAWFGSDLGLILAVLGLLLRLEPVLKDYVVFWCDGSACALFSFDQFRDGGQACGRQGTVRGLVIMVVVVR